MKSEIKQIQEYYRTIKGKDLSEDQAFNYLIVQYFYKNGDSLDKIFFDVEDWITDGANDGGVDFLYYDEEASKVIIGQSKYRKEMNNSNIIEELNKMSNTVRNFEIGNTGSYNNKLKKVMQNTLDRLPDEDVGNLEYCIFTSAELNLDEIHRKIERQHGNYSNEMVSFFQRNDIQIKINEAHESVYTVEEGKIKIDSSDNVLKYGANECEGIMVNISSKSLVELFNKYNDKGLFDLNIRRYIRNKTVDDGIKNTLEKKRERFWFLNNGLTIACNEFHKDGDVVRLYGFSIVNGGQTTNIIGNFKGDNTQEFFIPCKIISEKTNKNNKDFFNEIAEATNSQKPILPRDLKSNSPEMKALKKGLAKHSIELEIKRGEKNIVSNPKAKIKNDELGQLLLSFIWQHPGTSRSGKKKIFGDNNLYNQIFRNQYFKEEQKTQCLLSLIELYNRFTNYISADILDEELDPLEKDIFKNGKQIIFAILGILYAIANEDLLTKDILNDPTIVQSVGFTYRRAVNTNIDNFDKYLKDIIIKVVEIISEGYETDASNKENKITSVSNYFKTDSKYYKYIVPRVVKKISRGEKEEFERKKVIFM